MGFFFRQCKVSLRALRRVEVVDRHCRGVCDKNKVEGVVACVAHPAMFNSYQRTFLYIVIIITMACGLFSSFFFWRGGGGGGCCF